MLAPLQSEGYLERQKNPIPREIPRMPAELSLPVEVVADLPPRTWRGWWLAQPKWLRIGCWAGLVLIVLHAAAGLRMAIGLIEDEEITNLRARGAVVSYVWLPRFESEPIRGYEFVMAGCRGRSNFHVVDLELTDVTDSDLESLSKHFPNLRRLWTIRADVSPDGISSLKKLGKLWFLGFQDSGIGDDAAEALAELDSLHWLNLEETPVTDSAIPALQRMNSLEILSVYFSDLSREAIQSWRNKTPIRKPIRIDSEKDLFPDDLTGSIRWADGRRYRRFDGPAVISREGLLPSDSPNRTVARFSNLDSLASLHWPASSLSGDPDGDYRLTLKLGDFDAEPVIIRLEAGKPSVSQFEFRMPVTRKHALEKVE